MIYGELNVHLVRDATDLIGIRTLILRQFWQLNGIGKRQSDIDAQKPDVPFIPGGLMLMGDQTTKERGRFATYWTFQGINGDGKSVTFKDRKTSIDYGFEPGFAQVPIQAHRNFLQMLDKYKGYPSNDGTTVVWPPELGSGGSVGGLSLGKLSVRCSKIRSTSARNLHRYWQATMRKKHGMKFLSRRCIC